MGHDTTTGMIPACRGRRLWANLIACALAAQTAHAEEAEPTPRCVCQESVKPLVHAPHWEVLSQGVHSSAESSYPIGVVSMTTFSFS